MSNNQNKRDPRRAKLLQLRYDMASPSYTPTPSSVQRPGESEWEIKLRNPVYASVFLGVRPNILKEMCDNSPKFVERVKTVEKEPVELSIPQAIQVVCDVAHGSAGFYVDYNEHMKAHPMCRCYVPAKAPSAWIEKLIEQTMLLEEENLDFVVPSEALVHIDEVDETLFEKTFLPLDVCETYVTDGVRSVGADSAMVAVVKYLDGVLREPPFAYVFTGAVDDRVGYVDGVEIKYATAPESADFVDLRLLSLCVSREEYEQQARVYLTHGKLETDLMSRYRILHTLIYSGHTMIRLLDGKILCILPSPVLGYDGECGYIRFRDIGDKEISLFTIINLVDGVCFVASPQFARTYAMPSSIGEGIPPDILAELSQISSRDAWITAYKILVAQVTFWDLRTIDAFIALKGYRGGSEFLFYGLRGVTPVPDRRFCDYDLGDLASVPNIKIAARSCDRDASEPNFLPMPEDPEWYFYKLMSDRKEWNKPQLRVAYNRTKFTITKKKVGEVLEQMIQKRSVVCCRGGDRFRRDG